MNTYKRKLRRPIYMITNFVNYIIPNFVYVPILRFRFSLISQRKKNEAIQRLTKYINLPEDAKLDQNTSRTIRKFRYPFKSKQKFTTYYFDLFPTLRCFNKGLAFHAQFGDINYEMNVPTFVKTRPVNKNGTVSNSVICKLDKIRHFYFPKDNIPWENKKDILISRNFVKYQPHRTRFLEALINRPLCDVGQINFDPEHPDFQKPFMQMSEMLQYKFIACIEGHDVATNLKWVMSSNSVAVMPKPKIESWFLESRLIPGIHYIEVKDDFSDVETQLQYYIDHPEEAKEMVRNAHKYIKQFKNDIVEKWIQYQVVKEYLKTTNPDKKKIERYWADNK